MPHPGIARQILEASKIKRRILKVLIYLYAIYKNEMPFDFPRESPKAARQGATLQNLKENDFQPRILYLDKCERKKKVFSKIKVSKNLLLKHAFSGNFRGCTPTNKE